MSTAHTRAELVEAMAHTLHVSAYADACEEREACGKEFDDMPEPGPGEDWSDFAPPVGKAARAMAERIALEIEGLNGKPLEWLEAEWIAAGGTDHPRDGSRFANGCAMMSLGHGVSPADDTTAEYDNPAHPHVEFYYFEVADMA